jgi:hypothetical protein
VQAAFVNLSILSSGGMSRIYMTAIIDGVRGSRLRYTSLSSLSSSEDPRQEHIEIEEIEACVTAPEQLLSFSVPCPM